MPFAELSGARVRYEVTGDSARTVLFSHGFLMDHEMFDVQVAALAESFRCVTWDERGHGETVAAGPSPTGTRRATRSSCSTIWTSPRRHSSGCRREASCRFEWR